jgi:uncharacterized protein (TIGR02284 family)
MSKEIAALQKLLDALNDSSILYRRLAPKTTSSHLKLLLERAIRIHQWIAEELAERMTTAGGTPKPGGSLLGPLQALRANWLARISPDVELAYVSQALQREDAVLQRFDAVIAEATDTELRSLLQTQEHLMGNVRTQIECLGPPLPVQAYGEPVPQLIQATAYRSAPLIAVHARGRHLQP